MYFAVSISNFRFPAAAILAAVFFSTAARNGFSQNTRSPSDAFKLEVVILEYELPQDTGSSGPLTNIEVVSMEHWGEEASEEGREVISAPTLVILPGHQGTLQVRSSETIDYLHPVSIEGRELYEILRWPDTVTRVEAGGTDSGKQGSESPPPSPGDASFENSHFVGLTLKATITDAESPGVHLRFSYDRTRLDSLDESNSRMINGVSVPIGPPMKHNSIQSTVDIRHPSKQFVRISVVGEGRQQVILIRVSRVEVAGERKGLLEEPAFELQPSTKPQEIEKPAELSV